MDRTANSHDMKSSQVSKEHTYGNGINIRNITRRISDKVTILCIAGIFWVMALCCYFVNLRKSSYHTESQTKRTAENLPKLAKVNNYKNTRGMYCKYSELLSVIDRRSLLLKTVLDMMLLTIVPEKVTPDCRKNTRTNYCTSPLTLIMKSQKEEK